MFSIMNPILLLIPQKKKLVAKHPWFSSCSNGTSTTLYAGCSTTDVCSSVLYPSFLG